MQNKSPRRGNAERQPSASQSFDSPILDWEIPHAPIARCVRFLALNFHRPIRVSDLARVAGLSARGFIKAFQRHTGLRPGHLLIQLRVDLAKRILVWQDLTLTELAAACGFRRMNSFVVTFRREVGASPMKYRRLNRRLTEIQPPPSRHGNRSKYSALERRGRGGRLPLRLQYRGDAKEIKICERRAEQF